MATDSFYSGPTTLAQQTGPTDLSMPTAGHLLHAVVMRPPGMQWNGRAYTGARLEHIDVEAAHRVPGVVDIVVRQSFVGVIASQRSQALHGRAQIAAQWQMPATTAQGQHPARVNPEPAGFSQNYQWSPAQEHSEAAWAIAQHNTEGLIIWVNTALAERLKNEISALCALPVGHVRLLNNGQQGAEGYDAAVDAALLAYQRTQPVKVVSDHATGAQQLTVKLVREPAQSGSGLKQVSYQETLSAPTLGRPSIAALLCGAEHFYPENTSCLNTLYDGAIQTQAHTKTGGQAPGAITSYALDTINANLAAARIFARESFFDELCHDQSKDPVSARLEVLEDPCGKALIASVAERAGWGSPKTPGTGRGFACAQVIDNLQDPPQAVWSAWVAEVAVNENGEVDLARVTVGHSADTLSPVSATQHIKTTVRQTALGYLTEPHRFDQWGSDTAPDLSGGSLTLPEVTLVPQQTTIPAGLAWNQNAQLPAAAAIANAIFDASGARLRQAPFDLNSIRTERRPATHDSTARRWSRGLLGGIAASAAGLVVAALPWRTAITPLTTIDTSIYSAATLERGQRVALAGDCMVCHTAEGGIENAGGRPLDTPFGTVYTTNITPDAQTGIGTWSYAAFERAMREGIHQDGRHLYPVFPYTSFAKLSDADMQSLYGWLMTQQPVAFTPPKTELAFPYSVRPLMAGWNTLFHTNAIYQPDPAQSTLWNRGAYLVQGAGHCSACHSPRNGMGAEKPGAENFLAGGFADGWEAPALNALSKAPIAWTENTLFDYLSTGFSSLHGVASGPMGPVVRNLAQLPASDVRAMAHYLASLNPAPANTEPAALTAARLEETSRSSARVMTMPGEALFDGACAVCHDAREGPPLFGSRPSLALNTNLHSDYPDNVIQVLLHGIDDPTGQGQGHMPGFKDSLNDQQIRQLAEYMRQRFAPDKPQWQGLGEKIATIRSAPHP